MNYSPQDIKQGVDLKKQAEENPSNFGILGSATERNAAGVGGKSRMAGPMGARALNMLNDPEEHERTKNWMQKFSLSNEGMAFDAARIEKENPQPQQEQEEQQ